ncbi:N-acetylmannosamine-6-phosphate 2-epimerase [Prosthecomicrobium sp. N25]|uniref:N-acetylmannosamine-6-phosphate 2-epimerase n=1 Tax=Prosthecomicrobium sp. N25 TaxID=3129254 RepID=UPI0030782133
MRTIPKGALVVSCQARADNPLHGPVFMAAMAAAARDGGAGAIRADGPDDIAAIRSAVDLPIVGILKRFRDDVPVYITPDFAAAETVVAAGADIVALDATPRARGGEDLAGLVAAIRGRLARPVFADVSTLTEGLAADALGVDYVATTLAGYTDETRVSREAGPNLALVAALAARCRAPVVAEGRFDTPELAAAALAAGAHAVVVGTMITNPREITRRFAAALAC